MEIKRYTPENKILWNSFVNSSKNGTFLFLREYMEYHADRFTDHSLLVYEGNKLLAVLPAHEVGNAFYSHRGLTYGSLVLSVKNTSGEVLDIFGTIVSYLKENGFISWEYKCVPHIYHTYPAEEDLYALFRYNARLIARNISIAIPMENRIRFSRVRRRAISRADEEGVVIRESNNFVPFWKVLTENLQSRFGVFPVHTVEEITYLNSLFPDKIRLFDAWLGDEIIGGCTVYDTGQTLHVQYSSATPHGKEIGAIDVLYRHLIDQVYIHKKYIEFGQSTEQMGHYLNKGLIAQKEGFGGRGVVYDIYQLDI